MVVIIDTIKEYLNITTEQVFHIIDYLVFWKLVVFEDGKLVITYDGNSLLKDSKLNTITLEEMDDIRFVINESTLKNYIPKKI
ncbi:hypothetical protein PWJ77_04610 [Bacillus sp. CNPSo 3703]|uniref:hypothetical protein n=1 Tax=Bacillus altitudinis TaxID=293387 RepID=UPI00237C00FF|nr:hypothetical protein [Bacillus altitudinis]MDE0639738.1 hypothetical protein [Bacillus altitudinis]MED4562275.1 hypothetical protein [Bacillus altitudinis]